MGTAAPEPPDAVAPGNRDLAGYEDIPCLLDDMDGGGFTCTPCTNDSKEISDVHGTTAIDITGAGG